MEYLTSLRSLLVVISRREEFQSCRYGVTPYSKIMEDTFLTSDSGPTLQASPECGMPKQKKEGKKKNAGEQEVKNTYDYSVWGRSSPAEIAPALVAAVGDQG